LLKYKKIPKQKKTETYFVHAPFVFKNRKAAYLYIYKQNETK